MMIIFPQLENDWEEVRQAAVRAVSVFAKQNLFLDSNFNTDSHTISLLSHMDSAISLVGLQILSILKRQGGGMNTDVFEISDVVNLLKSDDMPVRLAGLRALQSLATDGRRYHEINLKPTIPDIIECVWDPAEDVRAAALETLGNFANNATFRDQVAMPEIESTTVESLLRSKTREIRLSIIHTIPKLINKAEFYPIINGAMPAMIKILTDSTDEETRVAMIQTVRNMVETGSVTSDEFVDLVGHTIPLLSDPQEDVRAIALQTFSVISKQELFSQIISGHLPELVATACQRNETGINEDEDIFRIQVLEILSSLAAQEKFRKAIGTTIFTDNTFTVKAETWPTRVAILNLMSSLAAKDGLKTAVNQIIPDIADALHDDENQDIRLAGVRFLSIPMVKEMFHDILNEFVPTLVDLLSDSEEEIRVAVLHTLSDLAKQDGYRKAINGALPALLDALKRGDWKTRVTALETWSALAQDGTFSDIVTSATPNISACLEDYDVDVRTAALATLSEFSQEEVFRLAIINAAPHVISGLENSHWRTRVKVLETLLKFAKNDAFEEIIIIFVPKILESLKDSDEDVRFAGLGILSHLIQQDAYCASIHGALQASDISTLEHLLSDQYQHVRIGAIQLFPKVIQLDNSLDSTATALSNLGHVLSDDKEVCIAALEAISMLVTQDMPDTNLTPVISKVIQLMKPDIADTVCEAVLRTLSAFATKDKCIESITAALPAILSAFMTTEEQHCRDAAAQVFLVLASHATSPETVHTTVLPILLSTLTNDNWHICVAGLNALSEFVQQEALDEQISEDIPSILNLLRHPKDEVRIAATGMAGQSIISVALQNIYTSTSVLLCGSRPEIRDEVRPVLKNLWDNVLVDFTNSEPITRVAALGKLPKLTEFAALLDNVPFTGFEVPIITALKDQNQDLYLLGLSILSKLVDNNRFRERLLGTISKVTALLSNKASHTRVEVLNNLLKLAEHKDCRQEIRKEVGEIISVLKDREPTVRSAGLKVLIKLAEEGVIPDRIKLTTPHLLTLVQSLHTRKDAVLLLTSLAREKTLRSELLSKLIPLLEESPVVSWGHLVLVESLFENERLGIEPSDLQFVLCFMMSKQTEVQDFILKFMTSTLQHYLETWRNTSTFPASVASIFSSALPRSRN
ncbi:armadillo-type protein [Mycena rosella]|uniref:Armadillo-type protein n=1 Tax=Mycena rosella TaxID=1033263 RepID=A0AAD7D8A4_MYCRO|nr:armadillo-type protein [Mycena rosella]